MKRLFKNSCGSVMMECVIVLPLHLLVLLGTVYLGTLSFDRFDVVSMDHFAAFVSHNSLAGLKAFYAPEDEYITFNNSIGTLPPAANVPYYMESTRVVGTRSLPVWLEGIRRLSFRFFRILPSKNPLLKEMSMASFSDSNGGATALRKNPRYNVDRNTTTDWAAVANEKFAAGISPVAVQARELSRYTRNPDCETWSVEKL